MHALTTRIAMGGGGDIWNVLTCGDDGHKTTKTSPQTLGNQKKARRTNRTLHRIFFCLPPNPYILRAQWILRRNNRLSRCSPARCRRAPSSWRAPAAAAASPSSTHVVWPSVWTGASTLRTPAITESAWWRTACSMCLRARAPAAVPMAPALRRCSRTRAAWRSAQRATSSSR